MTLAIARRMKDQLLLMADMRLTDPGAPNARPAPQGEMVKVARIAPGLALAFAGDPDLADAAVRRFQKIGADGALSKEAVAHFESEAAGTANAYILGFARSNRLVRIQDGTKIEPVAKTWIGDAEAADILHRRVKVSPLDEIECRLHGHGVLDAAAIDVYVKQFETVLSNSDAASVGGFPIGVISVNGDFRYLRYKTMWTTLDNLVEAADGAQVIDWDSEHGGIRSIIEPVDPAIPAVAINFPKEAVCFVFHSTAGLPRETRVYRGAGGRILRDRIMAELGIDFEIDGTARPDGSIPLRIRSTADASVAEPGAGRFVRTVRLRPGSAPEIVSDVTRTVGIDGLLDR